MIYLVTEYIDNDVNIFFFDSSKVDTSNSFEVAYLGLLKLADKMRDKRYYVFNNLNLMNSIQKRFGEYQDSMDCWERLKTQPPCNVGSKVELIYTR